MPNPVSKNKVVPVVLDASFYSLIETHAQMAGESLETFLLNRLTDSVEAWSDYCSAISLLQNDEKEHFCVRVID